MGERSSGAAGSAAILRQIIPSRIWRTASYHWGKGLHPLHSCTGQAKICESLPSARPAFSVGHFDPLVLLRVKSSAGWQRLISNRPWSVTDGIRLSSWQPDFYDSVSCRVTDRTGVIKMRTPVASLRTKSSYHFDNLILIRLKSSYGKRNLISAAQPKFPFWGFGNKKFKRYGILVLPKMGSTTLLYKSKRGWGTWQSLSSSSKRSMKSGKWQKLSVARVSLRFALAVVFLPTGIAAISGICPNW